MSNPDPKPQSFKGIALLTPGGDLLYAIDPHRQGRWHVQLCTALQTLLHLPEPPFFLMPAYSATLDRWRDPRTGQLHTYAELHPPLRNYPALLNALFNTPSQRWTEIPWHRSTADPLLIEQYRERFAPLWDSHHWLLSYDEWQGLQHIINQPIPSLEVVPAVTPSAPETPQTAPMTTHVLRVFISGHNRVMEGHLLRLHQLLETHFQHPYTLKVVDILKNPELAEADQITATPTLIRVIPKPTRRIVGTFSDAAQLLDLLLA